MMTRRLSSQYLNRAKNASIRIWNVHDPSASPNGPPEADNPTIFDYKVAWNEADLTSLGWNYDGSLVAAGSYDAILRVCDASGQLYFSETMHKVGLSSLLLDFF